MCDWWDQKCGEHSLELTPPRVRAMERPRRHSGRSQHLARTGMRTSGHTGLAESWGLRGTSCFLGDMGALGFLRS